jgi:hydroxymethylglutaryl-CoA reductase
MSQADKTERPIAKSIIVKSDQHSLKDAFAVAIKQNEKIKQMETESNEQGGMKRLLEGVSFVDPYKLIFSFLVD